MMMDTTEFARKWDLNDEAQDALLSLDEDTRRNVMADFDPREGTRSFSDLFCGFVKSRKHPKPERSSGGIRFAAMDIQPGDLDNLIADSHDLVLKFSLNPENQGLLAACPFEAQEKICVDFNPKDTNKDVNQLFRSFVTSRLQALRPEEREIDPGHKEESLRIDDPALEDFFEKHGIGHDAQRRMLKLPRHAQEAIMHDFEPRDATKDRHALFVSFLKSREVTAFSRGAGAGLGVSVRPSSTGDRIEREFRRKDPIDEETHHRIVDFAVKWNLSNESQNFLLDIPHNILMSVLEDFSPREDARDIDSMLQAFVKSRLNGPNGPGGSNRARVYDRREDGPSRGVSFGRSVHVTSKGRRDGRDSSPPPPAQRRRRGQPTGCIMTMSEFIRVHRLDRRCAEMLQALHKHELVLEKVINEFNPRDKDADVNKLFFSFWKSRALTGVADSFGLNREATKMFEELHTDMQIRVIGEFQPREPVKDMNSLFTSFIASRMDGTRDRKRSRSRSRDGDRGRKRSRGDEVSSFIAQWKLSGEMEDELRRLPREEQYKVMDKFRPKEDTRDCNNLFRKFVASFAR